MGWQYPNAPSSWITTVRGSAFPLGTITTSAAGTTTTSAAGTTTTTTTSAAATTTASSSGCSGVSAWDSTVAYTGGEEVSYNGHLWTAQWWTEDDTPGTSPSIFSFCLLIGSRMFTGGVAGVWVDDGACATAVISGLSSVAAPSASATKTGPVDPPFSFLPSAAAAAPLTRASVSSITSATATAAATA